MRNIRLKGEYRFKCRFPWNIIYLGPPNLIGFTRIANFIIIIITLNSADLLSLYQIPHNTKVHRTEIWEHAGYWYPFNYFCIARMIVWKDHSFHVIMSPELLSNMENNILLNGAFFIKGVSFNLSEPRVFHIGNPFRLKLYCIGYFQSLIPRISK